MDFTLKESSEFCMSDWTAHLFFFARVCVYGHSDSVEEYLVTVDRLDLDMDKNFKKKKRKKNYGREDSAW